MIEITVTDQQDNQLNRDLGYMEEQIYAVLLGLA